MLFSSCTSTRTLDPEIQLHAFVAHNFLTVHPELRRPYLIVRRACWQHAQVQHPEFLTESQVALPIAELPQLNQFHTLGNRRLGGCRKMVRAAAFVNANETE